MGVLTKAALKKLSMKKSDRLKRAKEQGYGDDTYYKGMWPYDWTKESGEYLGPEITEINRTTPFPSFSDDPDVDIAGFLTQDPDVANRFAGRGAVYPLRFNPDRQLVIDAKGKNAADVQFWESGQDFRDAVRSGEYDSIRINNTKDEGDITVALDPSNIRSVNAAFDPAKKDSANLLAGLGGAAVLGTGLLGSEEADASFGGVLAKNADEFMLSIANKMDNMGLSRDDIWQKTGWFKGPDEKWRFEIDDSGSSFDMLENLPTATHEPRGSVGDVLEHPDLYASYPDLADVRATQTQGKGGAYHANDGFNERVEYGTESSGLHELQHAIQEREGFAPGGNPGMFYDEIENASSMDRNMVNAIAWDKYKRLGGEAEARNTQVRRLLGPQERREIPPWETFDVPESEQIIRQRGSIDPRLLTGMGAASAGLLGAAARPQEEIKAPKHPGLLGAVNAAREVGRRLEGSPAWLLYPEATVDWLGGLAYGEKPTSMERAGVILDWLPM